MEEKFLFISYVVISLLLGLDADFSEEKTGGVQYRISEGQLNEISDTLFKNPVYYMEKATTLTVIIGDLSIQASLDDVQATYGGSSVSFIEKNCVQISAMFPQVNVTFSVTMQQPFPTKFTVVGTARNLVLNLTADISKSVGYFPNMTIACSAKADQINLSLPIDYPLTMEDKEQFIADMICPGYKEEFYNLFTLSFGFKSTKFDLNMIAFNLAVTFSTVDIGVDDNQLFLTQIVERSADNENTVFIPGSPIEGNVTEFPRTNITDKGFEFWLSENVIEDFWNEYVIEDFRESIQLGDIIPALPLKSMGVDTASWIIYNLTDYFLDEALLTFPVTNMRIWLTVRPPNITLYLNATVEVHVNRSCDENDTEVFHIFNMDMEYAFPVQIGISDTKLNLKILSFGGNMTIRDSKIGNITYRGLIDLARYLPLTFGRGKLQDLSKKFKGMALDSLMPEDLHMENVSVRLEPEHVVIESSLYTGGLKTNVSSNIVWTGFYYKYDPRWLLNLTEIRYEGKLLDEQKCRPPTPPPVSRAAGMYPEMFLLTPFFGFLHILIYCSK